MYINTDQVHRPANRGKHENDPPYRREGCQRTPGREGQQAHSTSARLQTGSHRASRRTDDVPNKAHLHAVPCKARITNHRGGKSCTGLCCCSGPILAGHPRHEARRAQRGVSKRKLRVLQDRRRPSSTARQGSRAWSAGSPARTGTSSSCLGFVVSYRNTTSSASCPLPAILPASASDVCCLSLPLACDFTSILSDFV